MKHQIVAIGDIHLRSGHSRNAARLKALDEIIEEGLGLANLGAWVQLGDAFDGRTTVQDRNDLAPRLQRMANAAPVIIARGNHDAPEELSLFGRLEARHPILVFEGACVVRVHMSTGGTLAAAVIPYPNKGGVIAAGTTADATLQTGNDCLLDVLRSFGATLADERGAGNIALAVGHFTIGGAITSSGQPTIGHEIEVAPSSLSLLGNVPIVLGHIHAPQMIGRAHYAGSITANTWGEREAKRFLIVEYDDSVIDVEESSRNWEIVSRPIDTPPMVHVDGELTRDGFEWNADGFNGPWSGVEARVRYRFLASERNLLNHASVREPFAAASRLDVEPVAVPDRALRAPEVATAVTLADKLRAWARVAGVPVGEPLLGKLALLETRDAQALLSDVATQAAALERPVEKAEVAA